MKRWMLMLLLCSGVAWAGKWTSYEECELVEDAYYDGDSFNVKVPTGYTYVFRLYGVDCPEMDDRIASRLEEQSEEFGVPAAELPKWGGKAKRFVRSFLRRPFTVHTRKEKAMGASRKNRYYCVIVGANGERLDEALVKAGLARAYGVGAEWPERMTRERFIRKLHALESKAKREGTGIWE
jgi:endonuclease YncB( thermonuclease family)